MALPDPLDIRPPRKGRIFRRRRAVQRAALLLFLVAPFLDLCRFDLKGGSLILAGAPFGLGELGAVYLMLVAAMLAFVALALIYGRLWCGWICPQTTLSELAAGAVRLAVGRGKATPPRRAPAAVAILALAALVAAGSVAYFLDPADYLSPPAGARIAFVVAWALVAADLFWVRHRFCAGLCPYGVLQSILADERTMGVAPLESCGSHCRDCGSCAKACFMGIDIRESPFDPLCLCCGDCIDASRGSWAHVEVPPQIAFRFGKAPSRWPAWLRRVGVSDSKRAALSAAVLLLSGFITFHMATLDGLSLRISPRFERLAADGDLVRNYYNLAVGNRRDQPISLRLEAEGPGGLKIETPDRPVRLEARERTRFDVALSAPRSALVAGSYDVTIHCLVEGCDCDRDLVTRFFVPEGN